MKIKLINPGQLDPEGNPIRLRQELIPGMTLPYLAALLPQEHEIEIIEEGLEPLDYDEPVDLVGITAITSRVTQGYRIADRFRARGVPVVMGGFHVSALPEEALLHCDAVVQGEAEGLIDQIIADTVAGSLHGIYKRDKHSDLKNLPIPRYDLLKMDNYMAPLYPVNATRGCPYSCNFCSVSAFYGRSYRKRPVSDVIADIKQAGKILFIVDDNLSADREYTLNLFKQMKPLNKLWGGQFNLKAANDTELVKAAADAGCLFLYLGVETVDPVNLQLSEKNINFNVSAREAIRNLKRHHIEPFVSMIIGFDNDDRGAARKILHFCDSARVPLLLLYILTPLPATPLSASLMERGVYLTKEWHLYDAMHALFDSPKMKKAEIDAAYSAINKNFYALPSILRRTLFPPHIVMIIINLVFRVDLKSSLHPWMGTKIKRKIVKLLALISTRYLMHPAITKVSKLIRYAEGRIIS